jgi:AraC family transcriptional regulator, regulatory protein of adaptative response / methylated-DNA-[protein]-cysteine methyltransferase
MDGIMIDQGAYADDAARWQAVAARDRAAEGEFLYAVTTTGVFCRPTCPSRRPRRENVRFFATASAASAAGFRPCQRCRPTGSSIAADHGAAIRRACALIEASATPPLLADLAAAARLSPYHFHRLFKAVTGVTPRAYAAARRVRRVQDELAAGTPVAEALYGAGYGSSSRLYEAASATLGMTPAAYRKGGAGTELAWGVAETPLGLLLVAASVCGIAMIELGDDEAELVRRLDARFANAVRRRDDAALRPALAALRGFIARPAQGLQLPLDIRGTAFQRLVWEQLQLIPMGETASYGEIARRLGRPGAARAVARACAANELALAIPCHRVIGGDGALAGYRWGVARKRQLLAREGAAAAGGEHEE